MTHQVTEHSRRKEKARSKQRASSSQPQQLDSSQRSTVHQSNQSDSASPSATHDHDIHPYHSISPSLEELASQVFLWHYARDDSSLGYGHFDYLPSLCAESGIDDHLSVSMSAVGLACLSAVRHSGGVAGRARRQYTTALQLTQKALNSPTEVRKDGTLLSVMLLGLFETITCRMDMKVKYWATHTIGATALLGLRGRQQFKSGTSVRMFMQLNSDIIVSCLQHGKRVSSCITRLRSYVTRFIDANNPAWVFSEIMVDFINFRAAVLDGSLTAPEKIIAAALQVDLELLKLSESLPAQWQHDTILTDGPATFALGSHYHVYQDQWVAAICNNLRVTRILLNELIQEQLLKTPGAKSNRQFDLSQDVIAQMASDICASVPQQAHFLLQSGGELGSESSSPSACPPATSASWQTWQGRQTSFPLINLWSHFSSMQCQRSTYSEEVREQSLLSLDRASVYCLGWPLFVAGTVEISSSRQRVWATDCLRTIGRTARIWEATALAKALEGGERVSIW